MTRDIAAEVKSALRDPTELCRKLGLLEGATRQTHGLSVRCPNHGEKNASCSVTVANGTVRVKCFACDFAGDALTLIATVRGLSLRTDFVGVLREACHLAERYDLETELDRGNQDGPVPARERPRELVSRPEPPPGPDYPPNTELEALWGDCGTVAEDPAASGHLVGRRIDPDVVARLDLARCVPRNIAGDRLPRWARFQGQSWRDTGHRMLVRAWDSDGVWRSVRAWRVVDGTTPKRLPPGGHKASGLVLANGPAVAMLRGELGPVLVVVVEGEPDWVCRSVVNSSDVVIGVLSGSWSKEFAARVPFGSEVVIRTHLDDAGERYAQDIVSTVRDRAQVYRLKATESAA